MNGLSLVLPAEPYLEVLSIERRESYPYGIQSFFPQNLLYGGAKTPPVVCSRAPLKQRKKRTSGLVFGSAHPYPPSPDALSPVYQGNIPVSGVRFSATTQPFLS